MTLKEAAKWLKGDAVANLEISWINNDGSVSRAYCSQKCRTIAEWYKAIIQLVGDDSLIGFRGLESDIYKEVVLVLNDRTANGLIYKEVYNERL